MAGERYTQAAKTALLNQVTANLASELRNVETAQGLGASSIPDPSRFTSSRSKADNSPRLVRVFAEGGEFIDQRNGLFAADCSVMFSYSSDADLEAAETLLEQYLDAIARVIEADETLGGNVVTSILTDTAMGVFDDDRSATKHVVMQGVEVHVQTLP